MSGRFGKSDPDKKPDAGHPIHKDGKHRSAPTPPQQPEDEEEDGDIATPKRDRDDEADL